MLFIENKINKNPYYLIFFLIKNIPKYLTGKIIYKIQEHTISIWTNNNDLLYILQFLKKSYFLQFKTLISITAVDYPENNKRFEINYFLLSYKLNQRLILKIKTEDINPVISITSLYKSSDWYEREIWDLFGIFFTNHPDLRRILTDYGFEGFPFRKDFPQSGFTEVRYDDQKKYVLYESLELAQEYRSYDFLTPWINT